MKGDGVREIGRRKGDVWDRFDRLQRNMLAFSRGKGKRRTVQRFRTYQDLSGRRDLKPPRKEDLGKLCEELTPDQRSS